MNNHAESDDLKRLLLRVAYLSSQGVTQTDIAELLGTVNQSRVSKLLSAISGNQSKMSEQVRAVIGDRGPWLETSFRKDRLDDDLQGMLEEIKQELFPGLKGLREKLEEWSGGKQNAPILRVFYSGPDDRRGDEGAPAKARRLQHFGRLAAGYVRDLLPQMGTTAVCWGKTLKWLASGLRQYEAPELKGEISPDFIPVGGEPLGYAALEVTSSKLAAEFRRIVGFDDKGNKSLSAVPTSIPSRFKKHASLLRSYFLWERDYQAIFPVREEDKDFIKKHKLEAPAAGPGEPLIHQIESVLTSVGTPQDSDEWVKEIARMAELGIEDLKRLTVGNMGGYFIPHPDLDPKDKEAAAKVREINDLWTGITERHLENVATKSRKEEKVGIIVLAIGNVKARTIKACIEHKSSIDHKPCSLVQGLIIDHELAKELATLRRQREAGSAMPGLARAVSGGAVRGGLGHARVGSAAVAP